MCDDAVAALRARRPLCQPEVGTAVVARDQVKYRTRYLTVAAMLSSNCPIRAASPRPLAYAADEHADMFQALRLLTVLA
jgi:hypothetical protein